MPVKGRPKSKVICAVEECGRPQEARGWCTKHYYRWKRMGDPLGVSLRYVPLEELVVSAMVDRSGDCWLWTGRTNDAGYALPARDGRNIRLHKWLWEREHGPVPDGMELDHLCRVRNCIRPDHLEAVTHRDNVMRGTARSAANAKKTHCKRGHPFSGNNLIIQTSGGRWCRICKNEYQRRAWALKRQSA